MTYAVFALKSGANNTYQSIKAINGSKRVTVKGSRVALVSAQALSLDR
jgi:hypothetical protein